MMDPNAWVYEAIIYVGSGYGPDEHIWMSSGPRFWLGPSPGKRIQPMNVNVIAPLRWEADKDIAIIYRPDDKTVLARATGSYLAALVQALAEHEYEVSQKSQMGRGDTRPGD